MVKIVDLERSEASDEMNLRDRFISDSFEDNM